MADPPFRVTVSQCRVSTFSQASNSVTGFCPTQMIFRAMTVTASIGKSDRQIRSAFNHGEMRLWWVPNFYFSHDRVLHRLLSFCLFLPNNLARPRTAKIGTERRIATPPSLDALHMVDHAVLRRAVMHGMRVGGLAACQRMQLILRSTTRIVFPRRSIHQVTATQTCGA